MPRIDGGLSDNAQLAMAMLAGGLALGLIVAGPEIHDGTGTVIATLAAGAGWLVRDLLLAQRRRRSVCQTYMTAAAQLRSDLDEALSADQLARFTALRPKMVDGTAEPTVDVGDINPLPRLQDINDYGDILHARTVGAVWAWRAASTDLLEAYKLLGTRELALVGEPRFSIFMAWIASNRDAYGGVCAELIGAMRREMG